jgi:hypothetical protein
MRTLTKRRCIQLLRVLFPGSTYLDRLRIARQFFDFT